MSKIAGAVILFNPEITFADNIFSYLNQVELLYIINNSEEDLSPPIKSLFSMSNIKLIDNFQNMGVAYAINQAASQAIQDGFEFLLTLDQDSTVSENLVESMLKEFEKDRKIGILSPFIIHNSNPQIPTSNKCYEIQVSMTSGSIIRLSAFKMVGFFLEKLFIDYVDHEYCLRMISGGYKVMQLDSVYIYHSLGQIMPRSFLFKKIFPTNHSPLRLYYRTRNRFYVQKIYAQNFPYYVKKDRREFIKELIKIIMFENKKIGKIKMIIKGYMDYKNGIMGTMK